MICHIEKKMHKLTYKSVSAKRECASKCLFALSHILLKAKYKKMNILKQ